MTQHVSAGDEAVGRIYTELEQLIQIKCDVLPASQETQHLTREQLAQLIDTAFWASLRSNEDRTTRVALTIAAPEATANLSRFTSPLPYVDTQIARLAPAVPAGGCLVVAGSDGLLTIVGIQRGQAESFMDTLTVEIMAPGTLRVGVGPFRSFAVYNGPAVSIMEGSRVELPAHLQRVLRQAAPTSDGPDRHVLWRECVVLADIGRMIVSDGHGGTVLVVPSPTGAWARSVNPFPYRFGTPDTTIREALHLELANRTGHGELQQRLLATNTPDDLKYRLMLALTPPAGALEGHVRAAASLAGVDGALVLTHDLQILGFGGKIFVEDEAAPTVCIFRLEPGRPAPKIVPLDDLGGMRHQSAARFIAANPEATALVVSQDRHMSLMYWDETIKSVAVVRNAQWLL